LNHQPPPQVRYDAADDPRVPWLPPEERPAWEKLLHGIRLMFWAVVAPLIAALACGLLCISVLDFGSRHVHVGWTIGLFSGGFIYVLALGALLSGLYLCAQAPASLKGKHYVQAALVFAVACGVTLPLERVLQVSRLPWRSYIDPELAWLLTAMMRWMPPVSAGFALLSWLLFARAVGVHLGQRRLAAQASRQLRGFCIWVAGLMLLLPLADFLAIEVAWLQAAAAGWMLIGGAFVAGAVGHATAELQRTVHQALAKTPLVDAGDADPA
jgi:hypothetical protein